VASITFDRRGENGPATPGDSITRRCDYVVDRGRLKLGRQARAGNPVQSFLTGGNANINQVRVGVGFRF
jgi:hypothetical protein